MDYIYMIQFIFAMLVLNVIAFPICYKLFGKMSDGGMIIGKIVGLYLSGYIMWLLSSCHILKFTTTNCIIVLIIAAICLYAPVVINVKYKQDFGFVSYLKNHYKAFIVGEILFIFFFIFLNWIFAHRIPGSETERMMDLGFMNSIYRTDYMPPLDMWSAGKPINYYYFGQYIITYLTKISFIPVGYGYTFGLFMIAAWLFVAIFRIAQSVTGSKVAGVISGCAVVFAGNVHYIVFDWFVPAIWDILQLDGEKPRYWFANSTRYIGYVPDVAKDKTIHEFPAYSFIVGDLHAHVVDLLLVGVIIALLWSYLMYIKENFNEEMSLVAACINKYTVTLGILLGICSMSNYWDLPIYFVVSGGVILFGIIAVVGFKKVVPFFVGLSGVFIYMLNLLVALPFNLKFVKMIEGIGVVERRSLFYQYLILWGFPVVMTVIFITSIVKQKKCEINYLFIAILCLCATGLTLIPEFVFVKDIYIDGFPRANTMFKLSYEAFVLFGLSIGCIICFMYNKAKETDGIISYRYKRIAIVATIITVWCSLYSISATKMWISDFSSNNWQGFDATKTIRNDNKSQIAAIDALEEIAKADGRKQPIVLEADGDSYSNSCIVSVLTGFPTILGWHTHEWLWHNSHSYMETRRIDVESIYTGTDLYEKRALLAKYDVDYIFIGEKEYEKYDVVQNELLEDMGSVVYCKPSESGKIVEIIKVK